MAYQVYKFDDVLLPLYNTQQEHSPGQVSSGYRDSIGDAFDYYGSAQQFPRRHNIEIDGWYVGELSYEVAEDGTFIVAEDGDYIVGHGAAVDTRVQLEALQSKIGVRGTLWRRWVSDNAEEQYKTARLIHAPNPHSYEDGCQEAHVLCTFETDDHGWHADTQTSSSVAIGGGAPAGLTVRNGGSLRVDDAVIEIAISSQITSINILNVAAGINLNYSGSLFSTTPLVIDCGASTVLRASVNAYSNLSLVGHTARGWLPLGPGNNVFVITADGAGTATIKHYDQWP